MSDHLTHKVAARFMEKQAGKTFTYEKERMMEGYRQMRGALQSVEGLFHYRLFGDGKTKGLERVTPALDEQQRRKAMALYKDLKAMEKTLVEMWKTLRRMDREFQWMDDNMGYS